MEGQIYDEAHVDRLRVEYTKLLTSSMRSEGYVVRADLSPDFTMSYNGGGKGFSFKLSVYGCFIGKKQAQSIKYLDEYRPILEEGNETEDAKRVDRRS